MAQKAGLPPEPLAHVGPSRDEEVKITIIDYDVTRYREEVMASAAECLPFKDEPTVTWVNVDGIHRLDLLEDIGECFNLHPLVLDGIANSDQKPKTEDYGEYLFVILKMLTYDADAAEVNTEHVGLVLGANYVLSFQEGERGDVFDAIRERIRIPESRLRKTGADYLAYALIDAVVDNYFVILEQIGERISSLEEALVANPDPETLHQIHDLKREMIILRKSVWPLREVVNGLTRGDSKLVHDSTVVFLQDVYDHTIQVIDGVETYRDILAGMLDLYLSTLSYKMNEVMKVLTIIATVFIPLTFIAGVYGMNFLYMPEIGWRWSYPLLWFVFVATAVAMLFLFKRKKWL
jgi:magnesium transporter